MAGMKLGCNSLVGTQRLAVIDAQKRSIREIGGSYAEADNDLHTVIEIDLVDAEVTDQWLLARLEHWEFRQVRVLKLATGGVSEKTVESCRKSWPKCTITLH